MKLEVYAASLFIEYCKKQRIDARWERLSNKRKLVWLEEALFLMTTSINEVKKCLKPLPKTNGQASYELGYYSGMFQERNATIELLNNLQKSLETEYENLVEQLSK